MDDFPLTAAAQGVRGAADRPGETSRSVCYSSRHLSISKLPYLADPKQFIYSPLRQDKPTIRLLRLLPSQDRSATIEGRILEYDLEAREEDHPYEALSYVWGGVHGAQKILLDGLTFTVTQNLHSALHHLRDRIFERVLWIDAICIDQSNKKEKAIQIRSMASVYAYARQVVVWLGEPSDGSGRALQSIRIAACGDDGISKIGRQDHTPILSLLRRDWFWRIWVRRCLCQSRP
jgi:hypothetical protein